MWLIFINLGPEKLSLRKTGSYVGYDMIHDIPLTIE